MADFFHPVIDFYRTIRHTGTGATRGGNGMVW
jgi:hypothetical protein